MPKEGGEKPSSSDKVAIECAGYFENGSLFYTNIKSVAGSQQHVQ
ncbi:MAG: hypothetical protein R2802_00395 [Flavobacteriaceae bacterium]